MICKPCNIAIENKSKDHSGHIYQDIYNHEGTLMKLKCQCDLCDRGSGIIFKQELVP